MSQPFEQTTPPPPPPPAGAGFLLAYLQHNDAICPLCKYNLRNLTEPRCPECGREIRLSVGLTEPFLMPWILTTLFVTIPAGVGLFFGILLILTFIRRGPPNLSHMDAREVPAFLSLIYTFVAIPLMVGLIAARRSFMKLSKPLQVTLAGMALFMDVACLLAFMIMVIMGF